MKLGFLQRCKTLRNPIQLFEKENIDTMDSKGEVLLTILSSLAHIESVVLLQRNHT